MITMNRKIKRALASGRTRMAAWLAAQHRMRDYAPPVTETYKAQLALQAQIHADLQVKIDSLRQRENLLDSIGVERSVA